MSRRRQQRSTSQLTIHMSPEMVQQLDQYQVSFGIDSRAQAAVALMAAGMSGVPLETMIFETCRAAVKSHQDHFGNALLRFFEEQSSMLKGMRP